MNQKLGVSFDVWNSLISPNPEYGRARADVIAEVLGIDPQHVRVAYSELHAKADRFQDELGISINHDALIYSLVESCQTISGENLFVGEGKMYGGLVPKVKMALESLFYKHPPILGDGIINMFSELRDRSVGYGIISNTSFVKGLWLRNVLREKMPNGLFDECAFTFWSDEIGMAKPSRKPFASAKILWETRKCIHVGDNLVTDGACILHGFDEFVHTKSPNDTYTQVKNQIINKLA